MGEWYEHEKIELQKQIKKLIEDVSEIKNFVDIIKRKEIKDIEIIFKDIKDSKK